MNKKVFAIWNSKENRLSVSQGSYGHFLIFASQEQAMAYEAESKERNIDREEFEVRLMELKDL